jgi:hypothetical protein
MTKLPSSRPAVQPTRNMSKSQFEEMMAEFSADIPSEGIDAINALRTLANVLEESDNSADPVPAVQPSSRSEHSRVINSDILCTCNPNVRKLTKPVFLELVSQQTDMMFETIFDDSPEPRICPIEGLMILQNVLTESY